ncbi:MND1 [Enterospora canceri]|uniref:Meiotic nuclear division protein 1 n=1 Tax=Enterospora canceri TaxID=1081671 RepID=A0A1Y1S700_9MICR|nr:MND1 [Enterospora canceri]
MVKKVSKDEKHQKIVNWFMSSSEVFVLKELEKKIPKYCGISSMILKDLLSELINDNKINCEKAGSSNLYWRFMYQDHHRIQCNTEKLQDELAEMKSQNKEYKIRIEEMKGKREETEERIVLLEKYNKLKKQVTALEETKEKANRLSKKEFIKLRDDVNMFKDSINEVTDDIYTIQGYVCGRLPIERRDFNKNFNISDDMDYVE